MISLGCYDQGLPNSACQDYLQRIFEQTRLRLDEIQPGPDRLALQAYAPTPTAPMTVREVQTALRDLGFFPGGKVDGICGYRTQAALRLFQEYVRTAEQQAEMVPDGRFGPISQRHLRRWLQSGQRSRWAQRREAWLANPAADSPMRRWLNLLQAVKAERLARPSAVLQKVNAWAKPTDTAKVAQWNYDNPQDVHLVGVRRSQATGRFDDVFVLLIEGLVFKFQGSTEPGSTEDPRGLPFLVPGQHDYHFGWHKRTYLALRPMGAGVLVVRSRDARFDAADLANGLEANATINIHWGGRGEGRAINSWSEGCQVINGTLYIDDSDNLVSCAGFAAISPAEVAANPDKTRGAYNLLADLVTAFSSNNPRQAVKYTLLDEGDLRLDAQMAAAFEADRVRVVTV